MFVYDKAFTLIQNRQINTLFVYSPIANNNKTYMVIYYTRV